MSNSTEKLQALIEKVQAYKEDLSTKNLLEALGFFAIIELLETIQETEEAIYNNLEAHIGALFETFRTLFQTRKKVTKLIKSALAFGRIKSVSVPAY